MPPGAAIADNLESVRRRVTAAAQRAHRLASSVRLVAISKTFDSTAVRAAAAAGQRAFGENRIQEALAKVADLGDLDIEWHLVGHLQSNKARKAAEHFQWIESVDSVDVLDRVDAAAAACAARPNVLIQVYLGQEPTKHGVDEGMLPELVDRARYARALRLAGLMTVPPFADDPEASRPWFRQLRALRDRLVNGGVPAEQLRELSMGMSHDFDVAIEEGATIIRVGTAIFGTRQQLS